MLYNSLSIPLHLSKTLAVFSWQHNPTTVLSVIYEAQQKGMLQCLPPLSPEQTHTHTYSDVFQRLDKPLYGAKEGPCHLSPLEISPWTHCTRALQCPLLIYAHKHTHILSCTGFFLTYVCIHALRSRKIIMKQSPTRKCLVGAYHINVKSLVSEHLVLVYLVCMNLNSSIYIFRRDFCITSIAKYNCKIIKQVFRSILPKITTLVEPVLHFNIKLKP